MSKSTEDRKYLLWPERPQSSPYHQMRAREDGGWQWVWVEEFEPEDVGSAVATRAEALWAAAKDAEDAIDDGYGGSGRRLANRLRLAARAVRS